MAEKIDAPFTSSKVPELLSPDTRFTFRCHPGVSCFNACCKQADVTLTPYDIVRIKRHLGMTSTDFLKEHTVPFELDAGGLPGVKLKTDDEGACPFISGEGCGVYGHRPSTCRYYPLGLMSMRTEGTSSDEAHYFMVNEEFCKGHAEGRDISIAAYRKEQEVKEYDEKNRGWYQIILKKRSSGPAVGNPTKTSLQFFFMASYDIDRFREFIQSPGFLSSFDIDDETISRLQDDDNELLDFSFRFLKQVLFGEQSIPLKEGAVERRVEERSEILQARREAEIAEAKRKDSEQMEKPEQDS
ncbi:MAG: YkgJ family cysteine cluster protein [Gammaproteobacteria bacterium]|nr:YkgJ family cysteine cluster protein [Gammaproteobacteria bacterium]